MNEKVSVIVPVYNVENYIEEMLQTLCKQSYQNLEILLIDDGSKDGSGKICDQWAAKDQRIRVFHQQNQGVSKARNLGLDQATGSFLMFADSDDWMDISMIEQLYENAVKYQADVAMCRICEEYEKQEPSPRETAVLEKNQDLEEKKVFHTKEDSGLALLLPWAPYGKLYRTELLEQVRFPDKKIAEDLAFNTEVICSTEFATLVTLPNAFYHYRIRENSAMKQKYQKKYLEGMEIEGECFDRLIQISPKFADINLVGCGVSLVFEKIAQLSPEEQRTVWEDYTYCKEYAKRYKKALLGSSSLHRRISGALKVYVPDFYLHSLSKRFRKTMQEADA